MTNAASADPETIDGSAGRVLLFDDISKNGIDTAFEQQAEAEGFRFIAGLDEVGRGCLAGPVVAAACILDLSRPLPDGLNDSKKLSPARREKIAAELRETAAAWAIGEASAEEIDQINILEATKLAMRRALEKLSPQADYLLIDALQLKGIGLAQKAIIKGDSISASIAAASIIAKTFRDELMTAHDIEFPQYGFAGHKGYGSAAHLAALREYGHCKLHRTSFRGVVPEAETSIAPPDASGVVRSSD
ncbi:MAG: ribonuclease HII [Acidobacteria bacterium]|nr:ribonuclease HII [Acidobacteriota bacterium]